MGFNYVKELISPEEIKKLYPLTEDLKQKKAQRDEEIKAVLREKTIDFWPLSDLVPLIMKMQYANISTV